MRLNRWINALWLLAAWTVLQVMVGWSAGQQGMLLATPAHIGGFVAGLLLQRPLLLWRYRGPEGRLSARWSCSARSARLRLEQPVQVDDHIFHLGIVDRALGIGAPGFLGVGIIVEQADDIDVREIDEVEALRVLDAAAEHEVKLAHAVLSAACADVLAASVTPSRIERRRLLAPLAGQAQFARRWVPVSLAVAAAALAVSVSRLPTGRRALVSAWVLGSRAAIRAPAARPPARRSAALRRGFAVRRRASATPSLALPKASIARCRA
jgi:hypothetical protein